MLHWDCPVRYKEMEFVIPDESFDNFNDPLQIRASLYSILCTDRYRHRQATNNKYS